jgi:hypothetical protein
MFWRRANREKNAIVSLFHLFDCSGVMREISPLWTMNSISLCAGADLLPGRRSVFVDPASSIPRVQMAAFGA